MIDNICMFLTDKMRKEMPDIDDERAEIINYGLQNIIGEIPKIFIVLAISMLLGIVKETVLTILIIMPYRNTSGGFHLHSHIGCIIGTTLMYCGIAFLAQSVNLLPIVKYSLILINFIFGLAMIKLYAPADTENFPILTKKERKHKKILSYIVLTVALLVATFIPYNIVSNIIILGYLIQTTTITRLAYKLTNNKYGHEVY